MYPVEGCAPERPTAFERLAKQSPSTAVLIELAQDKGYFMAENRFVRGEADSYRRKLDESEKREAAAARDRDYYHRNYDSLDEYVGDLEEKVSKLEKKLKPAKKVAKKTKKVSKK